MIAFAFTWQASAQLPSYCIPDHPSGCGFGDEIDDFIMLDAGIEHLGTGCSDTYADYTDDSELEGTMEKTETYVFEAVHNVGSQYVNIWIDLDQDGTFDDDELLFTSATGNDLTTGSIVIPDDALEGETVMRVQTKWLSAADDPCDPTGYGETHDYLVDILPAPDCPRPSNLVADNPSGVSVDVSFDGVDNATEGYIYEVYEEDDDVEVDDPAFTGTIDAGVESYTIDGLDSETSYQVLLISDCGATDGLSLPTSVVTFTTLESCPAPSSFEVSSNAIDLVELTWNSVFGATDGYLVEVYEADQEIGVDTPVYEETVDDGVTSVEITTLGEGTDYVAVIQSDCADEISDVNTLEFTTSSLGNNCDAPIEITSLPYFTDDDTANYDNFYDGSPGAECGSTVNYLGGNDVVYSYTPSDDETVLVSLNPDVNYAGLFMYESCGDIGNVCFEGNTFGFSQDEDGFEVNLTGGQTYYIVISTWPLPDTVGYELSIDPVLCGSVSGLDASTSGGEADLSWDSVPGAIGYEWIVVESGDSPDEDDDIVTSGLTADTEATVDELEPSTNYDVYVRSECADDAFGNLTGPVSFQTDCTPEVAPTVVEDFSDADFNLNNNEDMLCWSEATGEMPFDGTDFSPTEANAGWTNQNYGNDASNPNGTAFYINLFNGTGSYDWFLSQQVDLGDGSTEFMLEYDRFVREYYDEEEVITDMGDHEVHVFISTDGGSTWNSDDTLISYEGDEAPGLDSTEYISLDGYTGVVQFAFYAKQDGTTPDLRFYFDNIRVIEPPTCFNVTGLSIEPGIDIANLTWNDNSASEGFIIEVYEEGDDPEVDDPFSTDVVDAGETSFTVDGLEELTTYFVQIQADCGTEDGLSEFVGTDFTTIVEGAACDAPIVIDETPYSTTDNTDQYGINYSGAPGEDCGTTLNALNGNDVVYSYTAEANAAITVTLSGITANNTGIFVYESCPDIGEFCYAGDYNDFSAGTDDIVLEEIPVTEENEYIIVISRNTTFNPTTDYTLEVELITCPEPSDLGIEVINPYEVEFSWTPNGEETEWEVQYGVAGFELDSEEANTVTVSDDPATVINDLQSSTPYDFYVRAICNEAEDDLSNWASLDNYNTPVQPIEIDEAEQHAEVYCYGNNIFKEWLFLSVAEPMEEIVLEFEDGSIEDDQFSDDIFRIYDGFSEDGELLWDTSVDGTNLEGLTFQAESGAFYMVLESDIVQSCSGGEGELPAPFDFTVTSPTWSTIEFNDNNFSYYPNPVENQLNIQSANEVEQIQVYNMAGQLIKTERPSSLNSSIDLSDLQVGTYLMKVTINGSNETFRVIKK